VLKPFEMSPSEASDQPVDSGCAASGCRGRCLFRFRRLDRTLASRRVDAAEPTACALNRVRDEDRDALAAASERQPEQEGH